MNAEVPIVPIHDRVLVRRMPVDDLVRVKDITDGVAANAKGLVITTPEPECMDVAHDLTGDHADYRRVPIRGTIVAVGPGKLDHKFKFRPTTVKPGQVIRFSHWNDLAGAIDPELCMITEGDIMGIE
jgi:co-chaperonin GroES (HSP10)